jgi:hypothetical protein
MQTYKFSQIQNVKMPAHCIWDEDTGKTVWAAHQWLGVVHGALSYCHLSLSSGKVISTAKVGGLDYILDVFETYNETQTFLEKWSSFWWNRQVAKSNRRLSQMIERNRL